MTNKDFFFCYDVHLLKHIKKQGVDYIICARHKDTNNKFWMFYQGPELQSAIDSFKN